MNNKTRRHDLIKLVAFETIRLELPKQLNHLHGYWSAHQLSLNTDTRPGRRKIATGFQALGPDPAKDNVNCFVILISTFIMSLPNIDELPTDEAIHDGLRAAGQAWGLRGKPLEDSVQLGRSRFREIMRRFIETGSGNQTAPHETESCYWICDNSTGVLGEYHRLGSEPLLPEQYPQEVDLVVDEARGALVGCRATVMLTDTTSRERIGLWLALTKSGASFGYQDIRERVAPGTIASDDMPRKYKMYGQRLCEKLTGLTVISEGRSKRYSVAPEAWKWTWILNTPEVECSVLLNPKR